jgi:hypothetical protein
MHDLTALPAARLGDLKTELRELLPELHDGCLAAENNARHSRTDSTYYETAQMRAAREDITAAYLKLANAHRAYRQAVFAALDDLDNAGRS